MTPPATQTEQPALAPYAVAPDACGSREHDDPFADPDDPLAVDRHRVVHSTAFRRLQYKTQVFLTDEGDHFRTRMTHTLEVAQIARTLATRLSVNADLAEIAALAHDLGHPPFGHAGEVELNVQMADHGGFDHNSQSMRVIEYLEHPYPPFRGLNLTAASRDAVANHASGYDGNTAASGSLEAQLAALADQIAYDGHDIEDALAAGLVSEDDLADLTLWRAAADPVRREYPDLPTAAVRRPILDRLLAAILDDVVGSTQVRIAQSRVAAPNDVRCQTAPLANFSDALAAQLTQFESFLHRRIYAHRIPVRMDAKARRFVAALFEAYLDQPVLLPERYAQRIDQQGPHTVICDYIAGMTDRFCQDEYQRLFQPFERV